MMGQITEFAELAQGYADSPTVTRGEFVSISVLKFP